MHLRLQGCPDLCYLCIHTMPETASLLPSRDDREEDPWSIIQSAKYLQVNKQFINDLNINVLYKAVGGTRDRWIKAWIEGEAPPLPSLYFLITARPRTRRGILNFAKTRTRSRRVVFQNSNSNARSSSRTIQTPPWLPTPKYSYKCGILDFGPIWWHIWTQIWRGRSSPPPPFPPPPPLLSPPVPIFSNVFGAQELIPRTEFRQPMKPELEFLKSLFRV